MSLRRVRLGGRQWGSHGGEGFAVRPVSMPMRPGEAACIPGRESQCSAGIFALSFPLVL